MRAGFLAVIFTNELFCERARHPLRNIHQEPEMKIPDSNERGGILSALLLSGFVVACLALAGVVYLARNVHVTSSSNHYGGDNVSIDTPVGHLSIHAHDTPGGIPSDVPIYPGATVRRDSGGGAVFQWDSNDGKDHGLSVSATEMFTPDPVSKVLDFYRAQLPNWIVVSEHDGATRFELHEGGYKRIIAIHGKFDGTHIGVASVGEPASN